jgi:hypothetical protein
VGRFFRAWTIVTVEISRYAGDEDHDSATHWISRALHVIRGVKKRFVDTVVGSLVVWWHTIQRSRYH